MPFDPSPISDAQVGRDGDMLAVTWATSAPGSTYQVYADRVLAWHGTATSAKLPWPTGPVRIDIGVVAPADASTDFSSTIAGGSAERAELSWLGGTYLSPTIASFAIYGSATPGGPVSYASPLGSVPAYEDGFINDGYGVGGYGRGGYGAAASMYNWTSAVLSPGDWSFAVVPMDISGNRTATPTTTTVTIVGPPNPPARDAAGNRLEYAYNQSTAVAGLTWLASPV